MPSAHTDAFTGMSSGELSRGAGSGVGKWSLAVENELHSTWLDLDEKRSFLGRFKYHAPAFGLNEDSRTSNTSFESYALDLSQGILR